MQHTRIIALTVILILVLAAVPVSADMATSDDSSGVSRGDYSSLALYEAKNTYAKSESSQYIAPWTGIVAGTDKGCSGTRSLNYRYRLVAPDGTDYNQVVYQNAYDAGNGLRLSANGHFFQNNKAVQWFKVSDLINNANKKGFEWQGTWRMEFYFGDNECSTNTYRYNLIASEEFRLVDDSAAATTVTTTSAPARTTAPAAGVPAVMSYGVSANGVGSEKTTWGPGDAGQYIVAWIKITPGSEQANGRERYTVQYRLIRPDGSVHYDNLNQGNSMSFNRDGSADMVQYPVDELLAYPGNWQVEYYIRDTTTGSTTLVNTQRFTVQSGAVTTAAATRTQVTAAPTAQGTQVRRSFTICTGTGPSVYPESRTMQQGRTVTIPIMICNAQDVSNMDLTITYDPSVLSFREASKGSINFNYMFESNEVSAGTVKISFAANAVFSGAGSIALLTFDVIGSTGSSSPIKVSVTSAGGPSGASYSIPGSSGTFEVGTPVTGDYDGDNQLTARDALAALQISVGKRTMDTSLDVTGDGTVNSADAREILKKVVGK